MEPTTLVGVFEGREPAERALAVLKAAGFRDEQMVFADGPANLALATRLTRRAAASIGSGRLYGNAPRAARAYEESPAHTTKDLKNPRTAQPLTRREREVALLVACGLTNRQIADALVIAEKTAEVHVGHILEKLRLSSRAQVAAWTVSDGHRAIQGRDESLDILVHDLKNPLTAIRARAQLLARDAGPEGGEEWRTGLAAIQASATTMEALLDELLDMARAEANRSKELGRPPTNLVALAR
jgi:DNA-binding CsgD family transcriptional regulator